MTGIAVSTADVDQLVRRVERLESEREIQLLMVRYAESLDYGRPDEWAACFAADGIFDVRMRGEPLFAHVGLQRYRHSQPSTVTLRTSITNIFYRFRQCISTGPRTQRRARISQCYMSAQPVLSC